MAQQKSVGISGISFLLSVKYIRFMQRNAALDLFPLQRSCFYPFSPLSSASRFCLYIALYRQFQQFPVKKFHAMDRNRNSWKILLLHSCPNCVFRSFPCRPVANFKVEMPFNLKTWVRDRWELTQQ